MKINQDTLIGNTTKPLKNLLPYVLYDSVTAGDVPLSDNYTNYKKIDISACWYNYFTLPTISIDVQKCLSETNGEFNISFNSITINNNVSEKIIGAKRYILSEGNKIKKGQSLYYKFENGELSSWDVVRITKVIGWK